MTSKAKILVAGAGIGGLSAALALLQRGYQVEIYEQATELTDVGAGVQLSANGTRVLRDLGLQAGLDKYGTTLDGKSVVLWQSAREWQYLGLDRSEEKFGSSYLTFHRADLQRILLEALRERAPEALHLGAKVMSFEEDQGGVLLRLQNGETVEGDALVGADGVHSRLRDQLGLVVEPKFTGCVAWRGVIPTEKLPASISRTGGAVWVGPKANIVTYPLRKGRELNFVAIVERDEWTAESWSARGTHDECLADFEGWSEDARDMIRAVDELYRWGLFLHGESHAWGEDRVTMVGDAAHATLPFLAQGANMSIEDGMVLARCLAAYDNVPSALRRYEELRIPRTNTIIRDSAEQLQREHTTALDVDNDDAYEYIKREWSSSAIKGRYDWIYLYDAMTVEV